MISQKILIIVLALMLAVILVWFVLIDNYVIPTIQQEITLSYHTGYDSGMQDLIIRLFQQTSNCQSLSLWVGNDTKQIIDVACLQPVAVEP